MYVGRYVCMYLNILIYVHTESQDEDARPIKMQI